MSIYDLIVVGAGPGGYEAAAHAGKHGLKTLLIEKGSLGGTCLNVGCIPTKTLLASAHFYDDIKKSARLMGLEIPEVKIDYPKVVARKNRLVMRLIKGIEKLLADNNVEVLNGEAQLLPDKKVVVDDQEYSAENIIIATGSKPFDLPGLEFDQKRVLSSTEILDLEDLPESLLIVGAGVIGLEIADLYSSLGVNVSLVDMLPEILPGTDVDAKAILKKNLERQGCSFYLDTKVTEVKANVAVLESGENVAAEKVLSAVGRTFCSGVVKDGKIALGNKKEILVDDNLETAVNGVYAIGDVNNLALYAHAATAQGLSVVERILGKEFAYKNENIPGVIFTKLQIASVGKTDGQTQEVKQLPLMMLGKAQAENKTEGFLKLFLQKGSGVIEGVVIVADNADALIGEGVVLANKKVTIDELKNMIHPHPTLSEIYSEAARLTPLTAND